ncbi:MAG TPA: lysophospholipid acyltransferase family protein [Saprospiraceae bacterium]|nr:lysophospholipid acyltransferase family protein [Saprospiraceae bacterium]HND89213.1 lysophospholipid acyltransferase family protein [Saprospiraceae bacterium]HNG90551.1 lysophospholipid acyltransferase family protein [Saprospiraceae bacterium]
MNTLRLFWRLLFFVVYTTRIVAEIWIRRAFFRADMRAAMHIRRRWAKHLLTNVGVRFSVYGTPPDYPCILVANHRSYLDPILMLCHVDAYPVAKAELAEWPLMGKGAQLAGILYLRREDSGSRANILKAMGEKLADGFSIVIFPEGTTSALKGTLPFKRGVFQLAARDHWPVVPVALHFPDTRDFWVGRVSFLEHAWRRFSQRHIRVDVHYGPPLRGSDAPQLAHESQTWIEQTLLRVLYK